MIKIVKLNKFYSLGKTKVHALKDISLEINKGELIAIMGRSGAGKSTLLHILSCLDTFDTGSFSFDGVEISNLNDVNLAKIRNEKIGIVLQEFSLINYKTALFNVMLPMYFNKTLFRDMKKKAYNALNQVGICEQVSKKANQLSGGQRQRVAIARAMVNNPNLLLADEPTGALDEKTGQEIMDLFLDLNKQGTTVIIITHDMNIANQCSKVFTISDGTITLK